MKIRKAGSFVVAPRKSRIGGSFISKPHKVRVGGVWKTTDDIATVIASSRRYDDTDPSITYSGPGWSVGSNVLAYGGGWHQSADGTAKASFAITVPAGAIGFFTMLGLFDTSAASQIRWRVDGGAWTTVSEYFALAWTVPLFTTQALSAGSHTVEVEYIAGAYLYVDGYELSLLPISAPKSIEHNFTAADGTVLTSGNDDSGHPMVVTGTPQIQSNKVQIHSTDQIDWTVDPLPKRWRLRFSASNSGSTNGVSVGVIYGGPDPFYLHGASFDGSVQLRTTYGGDHVLLGASGYGADSVQHEWEVYFYDWTFTLYFDGVCKGSYTVPVADRSHYPGKMFGLWYGNGSGQVNIFDYITLEALPDPLVWESDFSANVLPPVGWQAPNGNSDWADTSGDYLHQGTLGHAQYFKRTDISAEQMTLDFSMKVNGISGPSVADRMWGCWIAVGSGTGKALYFHFFDDRVWISNGSSGDLTALTSAGTPVLTVFRRFTIAKDGANFRFFIDSVQVGGTLAARANDSGLWFGQGSTGGGLLNADVDYDWMRVYLADRAPDVVDVLPS